MLNKVAQYAKNVGKSVAYVVADVAGEMFENPKSFVDENHETLKTAYNAVRDYRVTFRRVKQRIEKSQVYVAANVGINSLVEDLKTGDWYAKDREERITEKFGGMGLDTDFDMDSSEFDWDKDSMDISDGDKVIATAIKKNSKISAAMNVEAMAKIGKSQIDASRENTTLLYIQNEKMMNKVSGGFDRVASILTQTANNTAKNNQETWRKTAEFYSKIDKNTSTIVAQLDELIKMQRNLYSESRELQKKNRNRKSISDIINANGQINLREYGGQIKKNVNSFITNELGLDLGGMMNMFGEGNALAMLVANPMREFTKGLVKKSISKEFKSQADNLNEILGSMAYGFIGQMNNQKNNGKGFGKVLGHLLGVQMDREENVDTSKYHKGALSFDGITKKAIVDVIPHYLRRIAAATAGGDEEIFDYNTGRWTTIRAQHEVMKTADERKAMAAMSEFMSYIKEGVGSKWGSMHMSKDQADNFMKGFERFMNIFYNNPDFNMLVNPYEYGIDETVADFIKHSFNRNNKYAYTYKTLKGKGGKTSQRVTGLDRTKGNNGVLTDREDPTVVLMNTIKNVFESHTSNKRRRESELANETSLDYLFAAEGIPNTKGTKYFDGFFKNAHGDYDKSKMTDNPVSKAIAMATDSYGYTIFDYLKNIKMDLSSIRYNGLLGLFGAAGGFNGGGPGGGGGTPYLGSDSGVMSFEKERKEYSWSYYKNLYNEEKKKNDESYEKRREQQEKEWNENVENFGTKKFNNKMHRYKRANAYDEDGGKKTLQSILNDYVDQYKASYEKSVAEEKKEEEEKDLLHQLEYWGMIEPDKRKELSKIQYDKQKKLKDQLDQQQGGAAKLVLLNSYVKGVAEKPWQYATDAMVSMEAYIHDIFFSEAFKIKTKEGDREEVTGLFGLMQKSFSDGFNDIINTISDKFKEMVDDKDSIYNKIVGGIKKYVEGPLEAILGTVDDDGVRRGGIFGDALKNNFDAVKRMMEQDKEKTKKKDEEKDDDESSSSSSSSSSSNPPTQHQTNLDFLHRMQSLRGTNGTADYEKMYRMPTVREIRQVVEKSAGSKFGSNEEKKKLSMAYVSYCYDNNIPYTEAINQENINNWLKGQIKWSDVSDEINKLAIKRNNNEDMTDDENQKLDQFYGDYVNKSAEQKVLKEKKKKALEAKKKQDQINKKLKRQEARISMYMEILDEKFIAPEYEDDLRSFIEEFQYYDDKVVAKALHINESDVSTDRKRVYEEVIKGFINADLPEQRRIILRSVRDKLKANGVKLSSATKSLEKKMAADERKRLKDKGTHTLSRTQDSYNQEVVDKMSKAQEENTSVLERMFPSIKKISETLDAIAAKIIPPSPLPTSAYGGISVRSGPTIYSAGEKVYRPGVGMGTVPRMGLYNMQPGDIIFNPASPSKAKQQYKAEQKYKDQILSNAEADEGTLKINDKVVNWINDPNLGGVAADYIAKAGIGGVVGTLLGVPMLGAGLGIMTGVAQRSEDFSDALFGSKLADGSRRNDGLFSQEIQEAFPWMRKGGLIGAGLGILTGMGPLAGLALGAAAGFAKKTEILEDTLFGDFDKEKVKAALPKMGLGALAGLILAPTGMSWVPAALLGATAGFASTTDKFKEVVFGKNVLDKDGNPTGEKYGGIVGAIKSAAEPFKNFGRDIIGATFDVIFGKEGVPDENGKVKRYGGLIGHLKQWAIDPLVDGAGTFVQTMRNVLRGDFLRDRIDGWLREHFGEEYFSRVVDGIGKVGSGIIRGAGAVATAPLWLATAPINYGVRGMTRMVRSRQIRTGKADDMTAEQRNEYRKRRGFKFFSRLNGDGWDTTDENIARLSEEEGGYQKIHDAAAAAGMLADGKDYFQQRSKDIKAEFSKKVQTYLSVADAGRIMSAVNEGRYDNAKKFIMRLTKGRDRKPLSNDDKQEILKLLNELQKSLKTNKEKQDLFKGKSTEELKKYITQNGFTDIDLSDRTALRKLQRNLNSEAKYIEANGKAGQVPEEEVPNIIKSIADKIDTLPDDIARAFFKIMHEDKSIAPAEARAQQLMEEAKEKGEPISHAQALKQAEKELGQFERAVGTAESVDTVRKNLRAKKEDELRRNTRSEIESDLRKKYPLLNEEDFQNMVDEELGKRNLNVGDNEITDEEVNQIRAAQYSQSTKERVAGLGGTFGSTRRHNKLLRKAVGGLFLEDMRLGGLSSRVHLAHNASKLLFGEEGSTFTNLIGKVDRGLDSITHGYVKEKPSKYNPAEQLWRDTEKIGKFMIVWNDLHEWQDPESGTYYKVYNGEHFEITPAGREKFKNYLAKNNIWCDEPEDKARFIEQLRKKGVLTESEGGMVKLNPAKIKQVTEPKITPPTKSSSEDFHGFDLSMYPGENDSHVNAYKRFLQEQEQQNEEELANDIEETINTPPTQKKGRKGDDRRKKKRKNNRARNQKRKQRREQGQEDIATNAFADEGSIWNRDIKSFFSGKRNAIAGSKDAQDSQKMNPLERISGAINGLADKIGSINPFAEKKGKKKSLLARILGSIGKAAVVAPLAIGFGKVFILPLLKNVVGPWLRDKVKPVLFGTPNEDGTVSGGLFSPLVNVVNPFVKKVGDWFMNRGEYSDANKGSSGLIVTIGDTLKAAKDAFLRGLPKALEEAAHIWAEGAEAIGTTVWNVGATIIGALPAVVKGIAKGIWAMINNKEGDTEVSQSHTGVLSAVNSDIATNSFKMNTSSGKGQYGINNFMTGQKMYFDMSLFGDSSYKPQSHDASSAINSINSSYSSLNQLGGIKTSSPVSTGSDGGSSSSFEAAKTSYTSDQVQYSGRTSQMGEDIYYANDDVNHQKPLILGNDGNYYDYNAAAEIVDPSRTETNAYQYTQENVINPEAAMTNEGNQGTGSILTRFGRNVIRNKMGAKGYGLFARVAGGGLNFLGKVGSHVGNGLIAKIPGLGTKVAGKSTGLVGKIMSVGGRFTQAISTKGGIKGLAEEGMEKVTKKIAGSKKATDAVVGATAGLGYIKNSIKEAWNTVMEKCPFIDNLIKGFKEKFGVTLSRESAEKATKEAGEEVAEKSAQAASKAGAKDASKLIGAALTVVFAVADYWEGWNNAKNILGILEEPDTLDKNVAGCAQVLSGLLIFFTPQQIADFIVKSLFSKFDSTVKEYYENRQKESEDALREYNEANGTDLTLEQYNYEQDKHKASTVFIKYKNDAFNGIFNQTGKLLKSFKDGNTGEVIKENAKATKEGLDNYTNDWMQTDFFKQWAMGMDMLLGKNATASEGTIPFDLGKTLDIKGAIMDSLSSAIGSTKDFSQITKQLTSKNSSVSKMINTGQISPLDSKYWDIKGDDKAGVAGSIYMLKETLDRVIKAPFSAVSQTMASVTNSLGNTGANTTSSTTGVITSSGAVSTPTVGTTSTASTAGNSTTTNSSGGIWGSIKTGVKKGVNAIKSLFGFGKNDPPITPGNGDVADDHIYQREYSGSYNTSGDSEHQTIADSGCGPAAAAVVARKFGNKSAGIKDAAKFAMRNNYKEVNGGTYPEFFDSYLGQYGVHAQETNDNRAVVGSLMQGKPVVLMGNDPTNSGKTPYASSAHYVVATGLDTNGNVIVEDSESKTSGDRYDLATTLKNSTVKLVTGRGKGERGGKRKSYGNYGRAKQNILSNFVSGTMGSTLMSFSTAINTFTAGMYNGAMNAKVGTTTTQAANTSTVSTGTTGSYQATKYQLSDAELAKLAYVCRREQGESEMGVKFEATLMCNLFEYHNRNSQRWASVYDYVLNSGWFASKSRMGTSSDEQIISWVRDVINNGNHVCPKCIIEHDWMNDLSRIYNGERSNKAGFKANVTEFDNIYGGHWIFWSFPGGNTNLDPFGYTKDSLAWAGGQVPAAPNWGSQATTGTSKFGKGKNIATDLYEYGNKVGQYIMSKAGLQTVVVNRNADTTTSVASVSTNGVNAHITRDSDVKTNCGFTAEQLKQGIRGVHPEGCAAENYVEAALDLEKTHGVNALFTLGAAIQEQGWTGLERHCSPPINTTGGNWGNYNIFNISGSPNSSNGRWKDYGSYTEAFKGFGDLVMGKSYYQAGLTTPYLIGERYCPHSAAENANYDLWGDSVCARAKQITDHIPTTGTGKPQFGIGKSLPNILKMGRGKFGKGDNIYDWENIHNFVWNKSEEYSNKRKDEKIPNEGKNAYQKMYDNYKGYSEATEQAWKLYKEGKTDQYILENTGVSDFPVDVWRNYLQSKFSTKTSIGKNVPTDSKYLGNLVSTDSTTTSTDTATTTDTTAVLPTTTDTAAASSGTQSLLSVIGNNITNAMRKIFGPYYDAFYEQDQAVTTVASDTSVLGTTDNAATKTVNNFNGQIVAPLDGDFKCSSRFGHNMDGRSWHNGVDLLPKDTSEEGWAVYSLSEGVVSGIHTGEKPNSGYIGSSAGGGAGNYVFIEGTDGIVYQYMHFNSIEPGITKGATVHIGTKLGIGGHTGSSSGRHLHFGMYKKNGSEKDWLNPATTIMGFASDEELGHYVYHTSHLFAGSGKRRKKGRGKYGRGLNDSLVKNENRNLIRAFGTPAKMRKVFNSDNEPFLVEMERGSNKAYGFGSRALRTKMYGIKPGSNGQPIFTGVKVGTIRVPTGRGKYGRGSTYDWTNFNNFAFNTAEKYSNQATDKKNASYAQSAYDKLTKEYQGYFGILSEAWKMYKNGKSDEYILENSDVRKIPQSFWNAYVNSTWSTKSDNGKNLPFSISNGDTNETTDSNSNTDTTTTENTDTTATTDTTTALTTVAPTTQAATTTNSTTLLGVVGNDIIKAEKKLFGPYYDALYGDEAVATATTSNSTIIGTGTAGCLNSAIPYATYSQWKQGYSSPWSSKTAISIGGQSLASAGCSLVSTALMLVHSGVVQEADFNPGVFASDINSRSNCSGGCGTDNPMRHMCQYKGQTTMEFIDTTGRFDGGNWDELYNFVVESMQQGYFCLGRVTNHYVCIDYVDTAHKVIFIMDPGWKQYNVWYDNNNPPSILGEGDSGYTMAYRSTSAGSKRIKGIVRYKSSISSAASYLLNGRRSFDSAHPNGGAPNATISGSGRGIIKPHNTGTSKKIFTGYSDLTGPTMTNGENSRVVANRSIGSTGRASSNKNSAITSGSYYPNRVDAGIKTNYGGGSTGSYGASGDTVGGIDLNTLTSLVQVIADNSAKNEMIVQLLTAIAANTDKSGNVKSSDLIKILSSNSIGTTNAPITSLNSILNNSTSRDIANAVYTIAKS